MASNIDDKSFAYNVLKVYAQLGYLCYYKKIRVRYDEPIPKNAAIIFAPNHQNALLDALSVLYAIPERAVFMARADIFKNKWIAKILRFLKILPIFRIRDGYESLGNNDAVFNEAMEVLLRRNRLVILPEGNHEGFRKLRTLKKGLARIAFQAQLKAGMEQDIFIVPVGLDYVPYFKFRGNLSVHYGKAIKVKDFLPVYMDNQAKGLNDLTDHLAEKIKDLIVHIEHEDYDLIYNAVEKLTPAFISKSGIKSEFEARVELSGKIQKDLNSDHPERNGFLLELKDYIRYIKCLKIIDFKLSNSLFITAFKSIVMAGIFPFWICSKIINSLPVFLLKRFIKKIKDVQFHSSLVYGIGIFLFPLYYLLLSGVVSIFIGFSGFFVLPVMTLVTLMGAWVGDFYSGLKQDYKMLLLKNGKHKDKYVRIKNLHEKITNFVASNR